MTEPTDDEIEAAWTEATGGSFFPYPNETLAFARTVLAKWGTPQPADCTRSHPHEDMSGYCLLRTEIARLANENARLKASQPVVREPLTLEQVSEIADASHREYDRLVSSGQCATRWSAVFAYLLERAHGITQKGCRDAG